MVVVILTPYCAWNFIFIINWSYWFTTLDLLEITHIQYALNGDPGGYFDTHTLSNVFILGIQVALSSGVFFVSSAATAQITSLFISSSLGIIGFLYLVIGTTVITFMTVLLAVPETKVRSVLPLAKEEAVIKLIACQYLLSYLQLLWFVFQNFLQGISLERMDELFEKPWLERVNIKFYLRYYVIIIEAVCIRRAFEVQSSKNELEY